MKCDYYVFYWFSKKKFVYASKHEIAKWNVKTFGKLGVPDYAEPLSNLHPIDELIEILLKSKELRINYENYGMPDHKIREMIRNKLLLKNT